MQWNLLYHVQAVPAKRPRTNRWISSSVSENEWDTEVARTGSAAYLVNNAVSPVLFHGALAHIPENAVVVEIGATCLLLSVFKKTLGPKRLCLGLNKKGENDNAKFFMKALGKYVKCASILLFINSEYLHYRPII